MMPCECKSGFFSLRDCGEPALGQCSACSRTMCREHAAIESQLSQCRDCWARQAQANATKDSNRREVYDDDWAYSYRHRYYAAGYAPVYTGHHYHHYYDDYDTRSFDQADASEIDDGDIRAGFGDS